MAFEQIIAREQEELQKVQEEDAKVEVVAKKRRTRKGGKK